MKIVPPGVDGTLDAAASGPLPFGLGWQGLARPGGEGRRVLVSDVRDRMPVTPVDAATRSFRVPPLRSRDPGPPVAGIAEVDGALRLGEDKRARHEDVRCRARVLRRVRRAFGDGHVTGGPHEPPELGDGHGVLIHPEAADADPVHRPLFGIIICRPHEKGTLRHPRHVLESPGRSHSRISRRRSVNGLPGTLPGTKGHRVTAAIQGWRFHLTAHSWSRKVPAEPRSRGSKRWAKRVACSHAGAL